MVEDNKMERSFNESLVLQEDDEDGSEGVGERMMLEWQGARESKRLEWKFKEKRMKNFYFNI